ncbi:MAG: hypothetical protein JWM59_1996 [Verrucomicrobiales bacterium]|nr:hypothetical protein [Verrucomicrobiales bacterium]
MNGKQTEGKGLPHHAGEQLSLPGFEITPSAMAQDEPMSGFPSSQAAKHAGIVTQDPHCHKTKDLAPMMLHYLIAYHAAARAHRLARQSVHRKRKGVSA